MNDHVEGDPSSPDPERGRKRSPWFLTTEPKWDDPPSTKPFFNWYLGLETFIWSNFSATSRSTSTQKVVFWKINLEIFFHRHLGPNSVGRFFQASKTSKSKKINTTPQKVHLLASTSCRAFFVNPKKTHFSLDDSRLLHEKWLEITIYIVGGGNSNIFMFNPNLGVRIQFDEHIFHICWFNHQLEIHF